MATESLTDLQLALMKALWKIREGSVSDVVAALASEGRVLAPTTVGTLLQRLAKQGWVKHRRQGRQFLYRAKVEQHQAAKTVLQRLLSSFFDGKISALTAQLLESDELCPEDLEAMRELIRKRARQP